MTHHPTCAWLVPIDMQELRDRRRDQRRERAETFIQRYTRVEAPPLVPEIRLRAAGETIGFWERVEDTFGPPGEAPVPFWAFAWAGGQALARYLLDRPGECAGRRVLDVASGSGLVAIAAALSGAASVHANEIDEVAAVAIEINARTNGVAVPVIRGEMLDGDGGEAELVVAGDVFYERPMAERMLAFLLRAHRRGAEVLVGDPGRSYLPRTHFTAVTEYDVRVDPDLEGITIRRTTVWRLIGCPPMCSHPDAPG